MPQVLELKKQKAQRRLLVIRKARKDRRSALAAQRRVSLAGNRPWRITNFDQAVGAMAKWA